MSNDLSVIDYFVIIGADIENISKNFTSKSNLEHAKFTLSSQENFRIPVRPVISFHYPKDLFLSNKLSGLGILEFAFPDRLYCQFREKNPPQVHDAIDILDMKGTVYYYSYLIFDENMGNGFFLPRALCLVSRLPYISQFHEILHILYSLFMQGNSLQIIKTVIQLLEAPLPYPGYTDTSIQAYGSTRPTIFSTYSFRDPLTSTNKLYLPFQLLGIRNVIQLIIAALFSTNIYLFSSKCEDLVMFSLSIRKILYPFDFERGYLTSLHPQHCYIFYQHPAKFYSVEEFLRTKIGIGSPDFLGFHPKHYDIMKSKFLETENPFCFVDMDKKTVEIFNVENHLPPNLDSCPKDILQKCFHEIEEAKDSEIQISKSILSFYSDICSNSTKYLFKFEKQAIFPRLRDFFPSSLYFQQFYESPMFNILVNDFCSSDNLYLNYIFSRDSVLLEKIIELEGKDSLLETIDSPSRSSSDFLIPPNNNNEISILSQLNNSHIPVPKTHLKEQSVNKFGVYSYFCSPIDFGQSNLSIRIIFDYLFGHISMISDENYSNISRLFEEKGNRLLFISLIRQNWVIRMPFKKLECFRDIVIRLFDLSTHDNASDLFSTVTTIISVSSSYESIDTSHTLFDMIKEHSFFSNIYFWIFYFDQTLFNHINSIEEFKEGGFSDLISKDSNVKADNLNSFIYKGNTILLKNSLRSVITIIQKFGLSKNSFFHFIKECTTRLLLDEDDIFDLYHYLTPLQFGTNEFKLPENDFWAEITLKNRSKYIFSITNSLSNYERNISSIFNSVMKYYLLSKYIELPFNFSEYFHIIFEYLEKFHNSNDILISALYSLAMLAKLSKFHFVDSDIDILLHILQYYSKESENSDISHLVLTLLFFTLSNNNDLLRKDELLKIALSHLLPSLFFKRISLTCSIFAFIRHLVPIDYDILQFSGFEDFFSQCTFLSLEFIHFLSSMASHLNEKQSYYSQELLSKIISCFDMPKYNLILNGSKALYALSINLPQKSTIIGNFLLEALNYYTKLDIPIKQYILKSICETLAILSQYVNTYSNSTMKDIKCEYQILQLINDYTDDSSIICSCLIILSAWKSYIDDIELKSIIKVMDRHQYDSSIQITACKFFSEQILHTSINKHIGNQLIYSIFKAIENHFDNIEVHLATLDIIHVIINIDFFDILLEIFYKNFFQLFGPNTTIVSIVLHPMKTFPNSIHILIYCYQIISSLINKLHYLSINEEKRIEEQKYRNFILQLFYQDEIVNMVMNGLKSPKTVVEASISLGYLSFLTEIHNIGNVSTQIIQSINMNSPINIVSNLCIALANISKCTNISRNNIIHIHNLLTSDSEIQIDLMKLKKEDILLSSKPCLNDGNSYDFHSFFPNEYIYCNHYDQQPENKYSCRLILTNGICTNEKCEILHKPICDIFHQDSFALIFLNFLKISYENDDFSSFTTILSAICNVSHSCFKCLSSFINAEYKFSIIDLILSALSKNVQTPILLPCIFFLYSITCHNFEISMNSHLLSSNGVKTLINAFDNVSCYGGMCNFCFEILFRIYDIKFVPLTENIIQTYLHKIISRSIEMFNSVSDANKFIVQSLFDSCHLYRILSQNLKDILSDNDLNLIIESLLIGQNSSNIKLINEVLYVLNTFIELNVLPISKYLSNNLHDILFQILNSNTFSSNESILLSSKLLSTLIESSTSFSLENTVLISTLNSFPHLIQKDHVILGYISDIIGSKTFNHTLSSSGEDMNSLLDSLASSIEKFYSSNIIDLPKIMTSACKATISVIKSHVYRKLLEMPKLSYSTVAHCINSLCCILLHFEFDDPLEIATLCIDNIASNFQIEPSFLKVLKEPSSITLSREYNLLCEKYFLSQSHIDILFLSLMHVLNNNTDNQNIQKSICNIIGLWGKLIGRNLNLTEELTKIITNLMSLEANFKNLNIQTSYTFALNSLVFEFSRNLNSFESKSNQTSYPVFQYIVAAFENGLLPLFDIQNVSISNLSNIHRLANQILTSSFVSSHLHNSTFPQLILYSLKSLNFAYKTCLPKEKFFGFSNPSFEVPSTEVLELFTYSLQTAWNLCQYIGSFYLIKHNAIKDLLNILVLFAQLRDRKIPSIEYKTKSIVGCSCAILGRLSLIDLECFSKITESEELISSSLYILDTFTENEMCNYSLYTVSSLFSHLKFKSFSIRILKRFWKHCTNLIFNILPEKNNNHLICHSIQILVYVLSTLHREKDCEIDKVFIRIHNLFNGCKDEEVLYWSCTFICDLYFLNHTFCENIILQYKLEPPHNISVKSLMLINILDKCCLLYSFNDS